MFIALLKCMKIGNRLDANHMMNGYCKCVFSLNEIGFSLQGSMGISKHKIWKKKDRTKKKSKCCMLSLIREC